VKYLRENFPIPIIGMEPGVKPAIEQSQSGMIGVLATQGTLSSHKFQTLLQQHANGSNIVICPCQGWVEAIELNGHDHQITHKLVAQGLQPILESGVDTLVLGCTHYPFLRKAIENIAGSEISIIDTGEAVAKQLYRRLVDLDLLSQTTSPGTEDYWCSAPPQETQTMIERLLCKPAFVQSLPKI
ncbi:MAG: aspartate/glutamate racemase family protein, partial [Candidatus Thiodiazotropha sp. 6PLUC3]